MFELEKPNYELGIINFGCDAPLAKHILPPFPNQSFFMVIAGKAGSGKTSLLLNMLTMKDDNRVYLKVFDKILLVMPQNSRRSIKNNPFDDLPPDQLFDEFSSDVTKKVESIREEYDELNKKEKRKKNRNTLLVMDDITATLKDKAVLRQLIELSTNRRHLKLSIILLVQYVRSIPRAVRSQITDIVAFKPANGLDLKVIYEEYVNLKKEQFQDLTRFVYNDSHDFLFIEKGRDIYYKNLQRINLSNNDNDKINML